MLIKVIYSLFDHEGSLFSCFPPHPDSLDGRTFPLPFPHELLINISCNLVLIFARVCCQVATLSGAGRKENISQQTQQRNLGQPRQTQINAPLTEQPAGAQPKSPARTAVLSHSKCLSFPRNKMSDSLQDRGHYLVWKRIPPPTTTSTR